MTTGLITSLLLAAGTIQDPEPRKWTNANIGLEIAFVSLATLDIYQTREFLTYPQIRERNPVLGKHPSRAKVLVLGSAAILAHAAIAELLPRGWREGWQTIGISIEIAAVTNNFMLGTRF